VFESVNIEAKNPNNETYLHFQLDVEEQQLEELWRHFDKNGVRLSKHAVEKKKTPADLVKVLCLKDVDFST